MADSVISISKWVKFTKRLNFDHVSISLDTGICSGTDSNYTEHHAAAIRAVKWYQEILDGPNEKLINEMENLKMFMFQVGRNITLKAAS
jgi:hypothetical protein